MHQHHGHSHDHGGSDYSRPLAWGAALNVVYVVIEAGCGLYFNSLALLADAGHNLSDVLGLLLALGAVLLARRPATPRRTYGFRRATILAAFISSLLLLAALLGIIWESFQRLGNPAQVSGVAVMIVAGVGVLVNAATAAMFHAGSKHDLNVKGAYLHMAADAAISLGVVGVGLGVWLTGWNWLDPAVSLAVAGVIAYAGWELLRDSFNLAVDAAPSGIDPHAVETFLLEQPGVEALHDLHIWGLSTRETALTVHLIRPEGNSHDDFLQSLAADLREQFQIGHSTVQIEQGYNLCPAAGCITQHDGAEDHDDEGGDHDHDHDHDHDGDCDHATEI
ncbi:cation diffusion facilitator family transporter [Lignipirellula cremea]|uniref:Cobalt-zinc-cadmium resistance protein CzcD n=1 Tax=Lignipirellula cremea TaxID=2528010 RepID=A0A518DUT9_9BACT|nr:cation diffusion facilitator family transporter [Lignipirellula cremea]QDU95599.1 Cobalt-zinc-cadmium resistance protein CzcD [Lignipirellula cremea]